MTNVNRDKHFSQNILLVKGEPLGGKGLNKLWIFPTSIKKSLL